MVTKENCKERVFKKKVPLRPYNMKSKVLQQSGKTVTKLKDCYVFSPFLARQEAMPLCHMYAPFLEGTAKDLASNQFWTRWVHRYNPDALLLKSLKELKQQTTVFQRARIQPSNQRRLGRRFWPRLCWSSGGQINFGKGSKQFFATASLSTRKWIYAKREAITIKNLLYTKKKIFRFKRLRKLEPENNFKIQWYHILNLGIKGRRHSLSRDRPWRGIHHLQKIIQTQGWLKNFSVLNSSIRPKRRRFQQKAPSVVYYRRWRQKQLKGTFLKTKRQALRLHQQSRFRFRRAKKIFLVHQLQAHYRHNMFAGQRLTEVHRSKVQSIFPNNLPVLFYKKQRVNSLDKLFFFFQFHNKVSLFIYKIFLYMEMLIYSAVLSTGLLKYMFLIKDACFYRLILLNTKYVKSAFQPVSLYDTLSIYNKINYYFYYQHFQQFLYNKTIKVFFQSYIRSSNIFQQTNKWLLQTTLKNSVPEHLFFDYPNILFYTKPFRRIAAFFFNAGVVEDFWNKKLKIRTKRYKFKRIFFKRRRRKRNKRSRNVHFSLLKLKLFEYACFF